jgi:XTP/dITP diphosphohydrolase
MRVIIATSNNKKVNEIKSFLPNYEFIAYSEIMEPFEIIEDGSSFKENAIIKAKAVYDRVALDDVVVLSDDSGICIDAFGGAPSIYSARFARDGASDLENITKVIDMLEKMNLKSSKANYVASIAIATNRGVFTTHGWMYGDVIDEVRGSNGFGYDPIFIPNGFNKTLGELTSSVKLGLSHRSVALRNSEYILRALS